MGHFYSCFNPPNIHGTFTPNVLPCSSPLSRPLKCPSLPNTSEPEKLRKASCQEPTTAHATQSDDRDECEESSYGYSCRQVFLSHNGKQKDFVEQLFVDLKRENISCFFDKDPQSLPKGEDFPSRIFEAAKKCKVGVVVLSEEFISSKWPMQELSAFVEAQNSTNPNLIILPLFFRLSTDSLFQKLQNKDSLKRFWQKSLKVQKRRIDLDEWLNALEALRRINGVNYVEQEGEVAYRAQIVGHIRRHLRPNLKYQESYVQGKERLCQEVAELFRNAPCRENGVKIAGLYGVAGIGKTTLAQIVCNFYSNDFHGRVFHAELGKAMPIETLKGALSNLTDASETLVNSVRTIEQGRCLFEKMMYGKTVFLAVDNISDLAGSIEEARMYLSAVCSAGTQCTILLTARSSTVLKRFIPEGERSCMHVPSLQEEEAIAVFLHLTPLQVCKLSNQEKDIVRRYVWKCYFGWNCVSYGTYHTQFCAYHPLILKVFGAYLFDKFDSCVDLSQWIDIHNSSDPWRSGDTEEVVFSIFEGSFQSLSEEHRMVFMLLCLYLPESHMTSEEALNWLALACSRDVEDIKSAVIQLQRKGFVQSGREFYRGLYIHDLFIEFAAKQADGRGKWISLKERDEIPASLQEAISSDRPRFWAMKIDNCHFQLPGFVNDDLFRNMLVLHLQHMPQLNNLDLNSMRIVRSITIVGCGGMEEIRGLENLTSLAYFRVEGCSANIQLSGIERLVALQNLEVHASLQETLTESLLCRRVSFSPLQCLSNIGSIQLDHFEKDTGQLHLSGCPKLRTIKLSHCGITEIDFSGCLELRRIEVKYCENLSEIRLRSPHLLTNLEYIEIRGMRGMHSLKELPSLTGLINIDHLKLVGMHNLKVLPDITGLTNLEYLELRGMPRLMELPSLTGLIILYHLKLGGMHSLEELPSFTGLINLYNLRLEGMHSLRRLPSLAGLTNLGYLKLEGMHSLKELPILTELINLRDLRLEGMHSLKEFPHLTGLTDLRGIWLEGMHSLKEVPSLTGLTGLKYLVLRGGIYCSKEILTGLTGLRSLRLDETHRLEDVPHLPNLKYLLLGNGMHCLKEIPRGLRNISIFDVGLSDERLKELQSLPGRCEAVRIGGKCVPVWKRCMAEGCGSSGACTHFGYSFPSEDIYRML